MLGGRPKLKDKLIENNMESDDQFIFYHNQKEQKFQQQMEIQAILNCNNNHKVLVIIDKKSSLDYLSLKIGESMENFHEYTNLDSLKGINLTKKSDRGIIKIPSSGEIKDHIADGDIIYCDLSTQEYWIKTNIKIFSNYRKLTINLDLKIQLETLFEKLKLLLLKLGINFWADYTKEFEDQYHYSFLNAKFKTIKSKENFELNINDLNKSSQLESRKDVLINIY